MDFENSLKETLINHYESIQIPNHLKQKLLKKLDNKQKLNFSFTKKVILGCLMFFLLAPTLAFGYSFLANQIYGSPESAEQYGITESEYFRFNDKLTGAAAILSPKEFVEFIGLGKNLFIFMVKNGDMTTSDRDKLGQVDVSKLPPDKQKEYNEILSKIQPYFDKLNAAEGIK